MKFTLFTPTYNRGYIIKTLYESLKKQTLKDFEWLVIDDGSTDDTEQIFKKIIKEASFEVRYYKKENGGKHTAANLALTKARGELFYIIDSDDYITESALERIWYHYEQIRGNEEFCGVCGLKAYFNGDLIGGKPEYDILDCTLLDYRYKYKIAGDKADVFKTDLLKQYAYPEFKGEKYCPQPLTWNKLSKKYKTRFFNEVIYHAEYLPDGISLNRLKVRKNSPKSCLQYYSEFAIYDIPFIYKYKSYINYFRFAYYSDDSFFKKIKKLGYFNSLIAILPGTFLYLIDSSRLFHSLLLNPNNKLLDKQNKK